MDLLGSVSANFQYKLTCITCTSIIILQLYTCWVSFPTFPTHREIMEHELNGSDLELVSFFIVERHGALAPEQCHVSLHDIVYRSISVLVLWSSATHLSGNFHSHYTFCSWERPECPGDAGEDTCTTQIQGSHTLMNTPINIYTRNFWDGALSIGELSKRMNALYINNRWR